MAISNREMKDKRARFVESCFAGAMLGQMPRSSEYFQGVTEIEVTKVQPGQTIKLDGQELKVLKVEKGFIFPDRVLLHFGSWGEEFLPTRMVEVV